MLVDEQVNDALSESADIELLGLLLRETREVRRPVRIAVHLVLERAQGLHQFLRELDELVTGRKVQYWEFPESAN